MGEVVSLADYRNARARRELAALHRGERFVDWWEIAKVSHVVDATTGVELAGVPSDMLTREALLTPRRQTMGVFVQGTWYLVDDEDDPMADRARLVRLVTPTCKGG